MGLPVESQKDAEKDEKEKKIRDMLEPLCCIIWPIFDPEEFPPPVVQIYDIWKIHSDQFQCLLSDGEELQHAIFSLELTEKVKSSTIKKGTVILMSKYELYAHVHHPLKRMLKILDMRVIETNVPLLGNGLKYILNMFEAEDGENGWMEEDWAEELWEWVDPDHQEWEEVPEDS